MNETLDSRALRSLTISAGIVTSIIVIYVMKSVSELILPFVVALLLARLSDPVISWFKRRKLPLALGIVTVLIGAAILLAGLSTIGTVCATQMAKVLPHYSDKANELLLGVTASVKGLMARFGAADAQVDLAHSIDPAQVVGLITSGFGSALTFISTSLLVLFLMLMIIAGEEAMFKGMLKGYGQERHDKAVAFLATVDNKVQRFLIAKTLVNLITGTVTFLILWLFGLDLAFVFAVLTFFLSYIPAVGGLVSFLLPIGLSLLQFDSTGKITAMVAVLFVVNTAIDRFVEPKVLGNSMDLSPLIVFVSFILFTWMWGTVGAILAVPITAIIKASFETSPRLRPVALMMGN